MSDVIKHINLCVTKEYLVSYVYKAWESSYERLLVNFEKCRSKHNYAKLRLAFYSITLGCFALNTLTVRNYWNIAIMLLSFIGLLSSARDFLLTSCTSRLTDAFKPNKASLEVYTISDLLSSSVPIDETSAYSCARALWKRSIKSLQLTEDERICIVYENGDCVYIKPQCIREGIIDAVSITSSGMFLGAQENVAKSSVVETVDVNISFERS